MSPESEQADALLQKAREDQRALLKLTEHEDVADSILGFHAQQSVEKALKAVLASRGVDYPWTHDLQLLMQRLAAEGVDIPDSISETRRLNPWAVEFRYGETIDEALDRDEAAKLVDAVIRWAENATG